MQDISCEKAVDFLSKAEEQLLNLEEQAQLQHHLEGCSLCRHFQHQTSLLVRALRQQPAAALTDADRAAILKHLDDA